MGDITFRTIVSFLHHNHRNEGVTMLKNIITPPNYYIILTLLPSMLAFSAKARLLISAWHHRWSCTLAICACRTQDNYKTHHIKINNETTLHA